MSKPTDPQQFIGVRPNPERDLLAGYEFMGAVDVANRVVGSLAIEDYPVLDVTVDSSKASLSTYPTGGVFRVSEHRQDTSSEVYDCDVASINLHLEDTPGYEQEGRLMGLTVQLRDSLYEAADNEAGKFESHLIDAGGSRQRARTIVNQRLRFDRSSFSRVYLLDNDGDLVDAIGEIGVVFVDRVCDLHFEQGDDPNGPTIRNLRDVTHVGLIEVVPVVTN